MYIYTHTHFINTYTYNIWAVLQIPLIIIWVQLGDNNCMQPVQAA